MKKGLIAFGLAGSRMFISKVNSKWVLDLWGFVQYVFKLAWAGLDLWRKSPWSVWGVTKLEEVFCPYPIVNGKFKLISDPNSPEWVQEWFDIEGLEIKWENFFGVTRWQELVMHNELDKEWKFSPWANNVQGIKSFYEHAADPYLTALIEKMIMSWKGLKWLPGQGNECDKRIVRVAKAVINPTLQAHGMKPYSYGDTCQWPFTMVIDTAARAILKRFPLKAEKGVIKGAIELKGNAEWWAQLNSAEQKLIADVAGAKPADCIYLLEDDVYQRWGEAQKFGCFRMIHKCRDSKSDPILWAIRDLSKDGMNFGISVDGVFTGDGPGGRPSIPQMKGMIKATMAKKQGGEIIYEYCPEKEDINLHVDMINGMNVQLFESTGKYSPNRGKVKLPEYEDVIPPPIEPPVEPPVEPLVETKSKVTWQFWAGLGALAVLIVFGIMFLKGC